MECFVMALELRSNVFAHKGKVTVFIQHAQDRVWRAGLSFSRVEIGHDGHSVDLWNFCTWAARKRTPAVRWINPSLWKIVIVKGDHEGRTEPPARGRLFEWDCEPAKAAPVVSIGQGEYARNWPETKA